LARFLRKGNKEKLKGASMKNHITVLAALRIGFSLLGVLSALFIVVAVVGGGLISGDETAIAVTSLVGAIVGGFILLLSLPGVVAGFGLLQHRQWARILTLVLAVFDLMAIPVGTLFGFYAIWVLMQEETAALFEPEADN
jgi:hypothetical protein